jgi:hypothetical protein
MVRLSALIRRHLAPVKNSDGLCRLLRALALASAACPNQQLSFMISVAVVHTFPTFFQSFFRSNSELPLLQMNVAPLRVARRWATGYAHAQVACMLLSSYV